MLLKILLDLFQVAAFVHFPAPFIERDRVPHPGVDELGIFEQLSLQGAGLSHSLLDFVDFASSWVSLAHVATERLSSGESFLVAHCTLKDCDAIFNVNLRDSRNNHHLFGFFSVEEVDSSGLPILLDGFGFTGHMHLHVFSLLGGSHIFRG
jgi:hypothetical protein